MNFIHQVLAIIFEAAEMSNLLTEGPDLELFSQLSVYVDTFPDEIKTTFHGSLREYTICSKGLSFFNDGQGAGRPGVAFL